MLYNNHYVITIGCMPATWGCMMKTKTGVTLALLPLAVILTGCGGGGGGSTSTTLGGFSSWSNFTAGSISLAGQSQEISQVYWDLHDNIYSSVTPATAATYNQTKNSAGQTTALTLSTATATRDINATDSTRLTALDPLVYGYDYQTYGSWSYVSDALLTNLGVFSVGSATPGASIPTSGTATYIGMIGGHLLNTHQSRPLGVTMTSVDRYVFLSDLVVSADFSARTLGVNTSNSVIAASPGLLLPAATNNVNMTGTLTYAAGSNSFSGTLTTGDGLSGTASGKFYGPAATELGGTVAMQSGGTSLLGAFGAKR